MNDYKLKLSLLWIVILFNMLFADILSIMIELVHGDTLKIPGEIVTVMGIAAIVTNIPIFMILLSWLLPIHSNRKANMFASIFTIIYVIGGGHPYLHYYIIASIEIICCLVIFWFAYKWKK